MERSLMAGGTASGGESRGPWERHHFEAEAVRHLDDLYQSAFRLSRSRDDAHDLVSATMLRALTHWQRFTPGTNAGAWLQTILRHLFIDERRRTLRHTPPPTDHLPPPPPIEELVGEADPEGRYHDAMLDDGVVRALEALPVEYRGAVVLSDLQERQYAEVAAILGVPEGTVKSRLFRGRRLLRGMLRGYAVEMGYVRAS